MRSSARVRTVILSLTATLVACGKLGGRHLAIVRGTVAVPVVALPADGLLSIRLDDVTSAVPRTLVQQQSSLRGRTGIVPFELATLKTEIVEGHRYVVRTTLAVNGAVRYVETAPMPVFEHGLRDSVAMALRANQQPRGN